MTVGATAVDVAATAEEVVAVLGYRGGTSPAVLAAAAPSSRSFSPKTGGEFKDNCVPNNPSQPLLTLSLAAGGKMIRSPFLPWCRSLAEVFCALPVEDERATEEEAEAVVVEEEDDDVDEDD